MKVYKESDFALPPNLPRGGGGGGGTPLYQVIDTFTSRHRMYITYPFIFSTFILPVVIYKNLY